MRWGGLSLLILTLVVGSSGCMVTEAFQSVAHYAKKTFKPQGTDIMNPAEEEDAAWITEAAEEARGDRPRERDPDQWYKKYLMSEKARSIERNLGFD